MPDAKTTRSAVTEHGHVLLKCAQQLLQMSKYVDVSLSLQGQRIFCHRLVLVSYSGYFDTLFTNLSLMPGATYDASLDDLGIRLSIFNVLLQFMYTGLIYPQGCELEELLQSAEALKIDRASEVLQDMIKDKTAEEYEEKAEDTTRKESRRGRPKSSDKSPTKKKRHKKKQDQPKKIPKISEEEVDELIKIKTEVPESESLLDPTNGKIAESSEGITEGETATGGDEEVNGKNEVMVPPEISTEDSSDLLAAVWEGLENNDEVSDNGECEIENKAAPSCVLAQGEVKNEPASDEDTVTESKTHEKTEDSVDTMKKRRGRPKGSSTKARINIMDKRKRRADLPRKILKSGLAKLPRVPSLSIRLFKKEDGAFHCDKCDFVSTVDKTFRLHIRRHTGEKPYRCNICGKGFIDSKYLGDHIRVHTGERPFSCEVCGARFKAKKHLTRHMLTHVEARDYQCDQCPAAFKSSTQLREHIARIHNKVRPHKCDFPACQYAGFTPYDLKMHKEKHGLRDSSQSILCDFCGKVFHRFGSLKAHLKLHSNKMEKCTHCDFTSPYKQVVLHHSMRHHGVDLNNAPVERSLKCDLCDFAAFTKQEYDIHMYKHSGYRPHKCPICNFAAVDKGTITKHLRVHTGDLPFSCKTCGKQFTQQSGLARHKRIHLGIKPHECPKCNRRYADRKSLRIHMFTHDAVKPFICHICSQGYVRKDILANHISKKHGPEMVPVEMRPQQKPKPLQVPKSQLEKLCMSNTTLTEQQMQVNSQSESQQQLPHPEQQQHQQPQQPNQRQQQQQQQQSVPSAQSAVTMPVSGHSAIQQPSHQSLQNNTVTAIPLVAPAISAQTMRTYADLSGESTITVDSIVGQGGLELSTIDPSSHHQLLGHMPLVATSTGHMGHVTTAPEAHHTMTVGPHVHQGAAVISQLIHPNSYITGLPNGMNMPPHVSHGHPHYQM